MPASAADRIRDVRRRPFPTAADHTERDAFVAAYGRDIRAWEGYPVLTEMRELSTVSAILRDGHTDPVAKRELAIRLRSLRSGDDQQWTSF
jgi:hypothetical protein